MSVFPGRIRCLHGPAATNRTSAAFRALVAHLRTRTDVQNIDLDESGRVLPQLSVQVVPRRRRGTGHRVE